MYRQLRTRRGIGVAHPPCLRSVQLESYLGIRVEVEGAVYGRSISSVRTAHRVVHKQRQRDFKTDGTLAGERNRTSARLSPCRKLSGALEQTADSVVITNRDGVIEYVNSAFQQFTGYTMEEVSGMTTGVLSPASTASSSIATVADHPPGRDIHDTIINRHKTGLILRRKTSPPSRTPTAKL